MSDRPGTTRTGSGGGAGQQRRTFRVESIPPGTSIPDLLFYFSETDRPDITVHSLAPNADSYDGTGELVATVSFAARDGSLRAPELLDVSLDIDAKFFGFTPLNALEQPPLADIIAVTGFGCHAFDSWAISPQKMWLRDFLPNDVARVRVLMYGCNPNLSAQYGTITDQADVFLRRLHKMPRPDPVRKGLQRPIMLIGHDVGCLVIKKALELGATSVLSEIPCIVFFGAPHHGLSENDISSLIGIAPSAAITEELGTQSEQLQDLDINFGLLSSQTAVVACEPQENIWPLPQQTLDTEWKPKTRISCRADRASIAKLKKIEAGPYWSVVPELNQALQVWTLRKRRQNEGHRFSAATSTTERSSSSLLVEDSFSTTSLAELPGHSVDIRRALSISIGEVVGGSNERRSTLPNESPLKPSDLFGTRPAVDSSRTSYDSGCASHAEPSPYIEAQPRVVQSPQTRSQQRTTFPNRNPPTRESIPSQRSSFGATWDLPNPAVELPGAQQMSPRPSVAHRGSSSSAGPRSSANSTPREAAQRFSPNSTPDIAMSSSPPPLSGLRQIPEAPSLTGNPREQVSTPIEPDATPAFTSVTSNPTATGSQIRASPPVIRRSTVDNVLSRFKSRRSSSNTGDMFAATLFPFVKQNDVQEVEYLIRTGVDITVQSKDDDGKSAIHYAAGEGHVKMIQLLLANGAKVSSQSKGKWTPLHDAAAKGRVNAMQALIEAKAHVNAPDTDDFIPLHLAAANGHLEAVRLLTRSKANLKATTASGKTALQLSIQREHSEVSKYLERAGQQDNIVQWPGLF